MSGKCAAKKGCFVDRMREKGAKELGQQFRILGARLNGGLRA